MNLNQRISEIESYTRELKGEEVEVNVYSIYHCDGRDLEPEERFSSIEYSFPGSSEEMMDSLDDFREEVNISWYGERCIPAVSYFGHPRVSFPVPNSGFHDPEDERLLVVPELAETVLDELEEFLENPESRYFMPEIF